ncbi:hypothetical protein [Qipengyuania sp. 483]
MKNILAGLGLASLALVLAVPAQAGVSQDFAGCDGLRKPKRSDDGMRGEATLPGGGSIFFRRNDAPDPRGTISSCDRAFETGKLLPEQTLRRAHMMRARAAANIRLGEHEAALADLDAADLAAKEYAGEFFYERSMGVSIDLLRAIAMNELGRREEAVSLARTALDRRPYALSVQRVATLLVAGNEESADHDGLWQGISRIDPDFRSVLPGIAKGTDGLKTLAASAGEPVINLPEAPSLDDLVMKNGRSTIASGRWENPVAEAMQTAYALAAVGETERARAWIDATRAALAPRPPSDDKAKAASLTNAFADMARVSVFVPMEKLVEGRIAIGEGRLGDAAAAVKGMGLRSASVTDEFHAAYAAAAEGLADEIPALAPLQKRAERAPLKLASMADSLLLRPESERKLIDYKKARPDVLSALVGGALSFGTSLLGGIPRTSGFDEVENADGSIKVEYTGDTTSGAVVQEMTLLRAAEIAQARGKSYFFIRSRKDFQRYLSKSQYGIEQSRTLTGYKTEVVIDLADGNRERANAVEALTVIDALGPIYYDDQA